MVDSSHSIRRRDVVKLSGGAVPVLLAGCTSNDGDGGDDGGEDGGEGDGGTNDTGDQGSGSQEPVYILTDYNTEAWQKYWENTLVPGFEDQTDTQVEVEYAGFQASGQKRLRQLIQAGDPPDLYHAILNYIGDVIVQGRANEVNDLNEQLVEQNGDLVAPIPEYKGTQFLVPTALYAILALNYRSDVYDQLSLDPPNTWSELLSNLEAIDEDSSISQDGIAVPGQKTGESRAFFRTFLRAADASFYRWKSDAKEEEEVWFPEEKVVETLEFMKQIAEYSPDPSSVSWGPALKLYAGNKVVHMSTVSPWGAGIAAAAGADAIARNTGVTVTPAMDGTNPADRGVRQFDGTPIIEGGGNPEGAAKFLEYMYADPSMTAENYLQDPTRFIPVFKGIQDTDAYRGAEIFQKYDGHLYDLMRQTVEEIMPQLSQRDTPETPAIWYSSRQPDIEEMMNAVLVQGKSPREAYSTARDKLEQHLEKGKQLAADNI